MRKFCATAVLVLLVMAFATTSAGFYWAKIPTDDGREQRAYFTLSLPNRTIHVTDEHLRGGWWNATAQRDLYGGKNLFDFVQTIDQKNPEKAIRQNLPDVWALVQRLEAEHYTAPSDGIVTFDPDGEDKFDVSGQRVGYAIDRARLCRDIWATLRGGAHNTIVVDNKTIKPRPKPEILGQIAFRGGYRTNFTSYPNREHNIALALKKFNGLAIAPGQSVSFNTIVGPRSQARGFKEAKIIKDGAFTPGIGGGVCQASTTLFNALLLSGVRIDKSYNHSLPISYVPLGRDAMVSSAADLKFTNDTSSDIYIETKTKFATESENGFAHVKIYGAKPRVQYRPRVVEVCPQNPCPDGTPIPETPEGERPKLKTRTYLDTYSGDKLVHTKLVRKSAYKN